MHTKYASLLLSLWLLGLVQAAHIGVLDRRASLPLCTAWSTQCKSACSNKVTVNTCIATSSDTYAFGCQCNNGTWTSDFTMRRILGLLPIQVSLTATQTTFSTITNYISTATLSATTTLITPATVTVTVDQNGNQVQSAQRRRHVENNRRDLTSNATASAFCQAYSDQCAAQCAATSAYLVGNNTCALVQSNPDYYKVACSCVYGPPKVIAPTAILSRIYGNAAPDTTITVATTVKTLPPTTFTATLTTNVTATSTTTQTTTATVTQQAAAAAKNYFYIQRQDGRRVEYDYDHPGTPGYWGAYGDGYELLQGNDDGTNLIGFMHIPTKGLVYVNADGLTSSALDGRSPPSDLNAYVFCGYNKGQSTVACSPRGATVSYSFYDCSNRVYLLPSGTVKQGCTAYAVSGIVANI